MGGGDASHELIPYIHVDYRSQTPTLFQLQVTHIPVSDAPHSHLATISRGDVVDVSDTATGEAPALTTCLYPFYNTQRPLQQEDSTGFHCVPCICYMCSSRSAHGGTRGVASRYEHTSYKTLCALNPFPTGPPWTLSNKNIMTLALL